MASVVEICNLALSSIGKSVPISSLDEASEEARQCSVHYGQARDWLLQEYPYVFARKVQALAALTNDWTERWGYRYSKPNDCLKIIRLVPEIDDPDNLDVPYGLRAQSIYADIDTATLEYTFRQEDPSKFPSQFVDALAWALAARLAFPLTRDRQLRADAAQMAQQMRLSAESSNANDGQNDYSFIPDHLRARD
jgi:hypothetical protein